MKKRTKIVQATLALIILSTSFSCSALPLVPKLPDRRLRPKPDAPAIWHYRYEKCAKRFIFCFKYKWIEDTFDTRDPATWQKFIDMGGTITFERRWQ